MWVQKTQYQQFKYIFMEIIQIYSDQKLYQKNQLKQISNFGLSSFSDIKPSVTQHNSSIFIINTFLQKLNNISLISTINLIKSLDLRIFISLIETSLINIKKKQDRNILIRYALKINEKSRYFCVLLHPISGDIVLQTHLLLSNKQFQTQSFKDIILTLFQSFKIQSLNLYQHFLQFLIPSHFRQVQLFKLNNQLLKRSIKTAPFYAWNMLRTTTQSKVNKQKKKYEQIRNEFLQKKFIFTQDAVIKEICKLMNIDTSKKILPHQIFQYEQQQFLRQKYLANLNFNIQCKLINEITLSQENLAKLLKQKNTKIESHETGKIQVLSTVFPNQKIDALKYQRQVLKKLPNYQFMGLPKYYIVKNYKQQTSNYTITNLHSGILYYAFLHKNSQSITIFTKIHILHQILLILKYLNRYEIVYHNLDPKNLIVRKYLYVKAKDFTNAYQSNLKFASKKLPWLAWRNIFPYVSNYKKQLNLSYGDQKSDVFSFGMIMYETFYGTTPYFCKRNLRQDEYNAQQLLNPPVLGIQKQKNLLDQLFSILIYASLECIRYDVIIDNVLKQINFINNQYDPKNLSIKSRPHIDWLVVIFKIVIQSSLEIFF